MRPGCTRPDPARPVSDAPDHTSQQPVHHHVLHSVNQAQAQAWLNPSQAASLSSNASLPSNPAPTRTLMNWPMTLFPRVWYFPSSDSLSASSGASRVQLRFRRSGRRPDATTPALGCSRPPSIEVSSNGEEEEDAGCRATSVPAAAAVPGRGRDEVTRSVGDGVGVAGGESGGCRGVGWR